MQPWCRALCKYTFLPNLEFSLTMSISLHCYDSELQNCDTPLHKALKTRTSIDIGFNPPILKSANVVNIRQYNEIDVKLYFADMHILLKLK